MTTELHIANSIASARARSAQDLAVVRMVENARREERRSRRAARRAAAR
jgi:hypothetical protein